MVMRGAAPTAICPRCSAESPPSDQPLITCAKCKLSFDPRDEPVVRPRRPAKQEYEPAPPGFRIVREPGEWTIAWAFDRLKGIAALVLGLFCCAVLFGNLDTPGEDWKHLVALGVGASLLVYVGVAWAFGELVLHVDARQVMLRREPLPLKRPLWIGRHEILEIRETRSQEAVPSWYGVVAVTPRGNYILVEFDDDGNRTAKEAAACVAEVVREAIAEIPPD